MIYDKERLYLKWKYQYYNTHSEVTDSMFDKLEEELRNLNSDVVNIPDSPTYSILEKYNLINELCVGEKDVRFKHIFPMLSLKKYQTTLNDNDEEVFPYDISNFFNKIKNSYVICTPKFDGNSMELTYIINGDEAIFNQSLTRGNEDLGGGIDKTDKLKLIVPNVIKSVNNDYNKIVIRGEVIVKTSTWENKYSDPNKVDNPRNWVAGILNKDDIDIEIIKDLDFIAYQITYVKNNIFNRPNNQLEFIKDLGFQEVFSIETNNEQDFFTSVYPLFKEYRLKSQYQLDGIVLNYKPEYWDLLGENDHHPHWACAVKFIPNRAVTYLEDILWNLGKDGQYTPIAKFKPVELDGTIVKHATLHNLGWIIENKVYPGCKVEIAKQGEIIPAVKKVLEKSEHDQEYQDYINEMINKLLYE